MNENDHPGESSSRDAPGPTGPPASSVEAPLPPPPPPPSRRPSFHFVRARHDRKLGGVAGGLATAAGLDPTLVRMGMVVGALTGWLVLAYLIAWALIPEEDEEAGRPLAPASEDAARLLRIGLAVVAGLGALQIAGIVAAVAFAIVGTIGALFRPFIDPFAGSYGGFNPDFPVRGIAGLILLVGGGLFLLRHRRGEQAPGDGGNGGSGGGSGGGGSGGDGFTPPPPPGAPVPPGAAPAEAPTGGRWRSAGEWILLVTRATGWLLALWFAAAGAVLAAFWAFDAISLRVPLVLAMVTLGALGLLGTVLVRSRRPALLMASAAVLIVPVILTLVLARWNGVAGYRALTPTATAELPDVYRHAAGEFRLDLSELSLPSGTTEVEIDMGAGEVEVTVPWDVTVEGAATVGVGEFNLLGRSQAGLSLDGEVRSAGQPGAPTIKIIGRVSAGQFKIFRRSPPATRIAPPVEAKPATTPGAENPPVEGTPPSTGGPPPAMPPGTYVCDFPAGGGPATCRPA